MEEAAREMSFFTIFKSTLQRTLSRVRFYNQGDYGAITEWVTKWIGMEEIEQERSLWIILIT